MARDSSCDYIGCVDESGFSFGSKTLDKADQGEIEAFLDRMRADLPRALADERADRAARSAWVTERVGAAVEHLWLLRELIREGVSWAAGAVPDALGELDKLEPEEVSDHDAIYDWHQVMVGLATHGLDVLGEVAALVQAGFPDGAFARCRTLYELVVVAELLGRFRESEPTLVERFRVHQRVFAERTTRLLLATGQPGLRDVLDDDLLETIKTGTEELAAKYGEPFLRPHGWAAPLLPARKRITFEALSELASGGGTEILYALSSVQVHADSSSWHERFRRMSEAERWSIGPSVDGAGLAVELASFCAVHLAEMAIPTIINTGRQRDETGALVFAGIRDFATRRPEIPESDRSDDDSSSEHPQEV